MCFIAIGICSLSPTLPTPFLHMSPFPPLCPFSHSFHALPLSQDCNDEYDEEEDEEGEHIARHSRDPRDRKVHRGQFAFQDRESGMFFQAFEPDFKAFLWQNFGARIAQVEASNSRAGDFTALHMIAPSCIR